MFGIEVRTSSLHGRGVFACITFEEGDLVEECPVLTMDAGGLALMEGTPLWGYCYEWDETGGAFALGFGSLYNHHPHGNATWEADQDAAVIRLWASRTITPGEEIVFDYTADGEIELWFDPA